MDNLLKKMYAQWVSKVAVIKSGLFLFLGIFVGRILGLLREIVLAGHLGTSTHADTVIALITFPDILINIFIGNAMSVILIPKIQDLENSQKFKFMLKISFLFLILFGLMSVALEFNIESLASVILPSQKNSEVFISELRWVILSVPFLVLNSISRVFLQNENRFGLMSFENIFFNACLIIGILLINPDSSLRIISISVILGSILRWLYQFFYLLQIYPINSKNNNYKFLQRNDLINYSHALVSGLILQFIPIFSRSLSSHFSGDGALSVFNYAFKFTEFPLALVFSVVSTVLYPRLTRAHHANDTSHQQIFKKVHSLTFNYLTPLCIITSAFLFSASSRDEILQLFPKLQMQLILKCISVAVLFLSIRAANEVYIVGLNSINSIKETLKSSLYPTPLGLVMIYFLGLQNGVIGVFLGLNVYYILVYLLNVYFYKKNQRISFNKKFIKSSVYSISMVFVMLIISILLLSQHLSIALYLFIWCLLIMTLLIYTFIELRKELKDA